MLADPGEGVLSMSGQHSTTKLVSDMDALCQRVDATHHLMVDIWLLVPNVYHRVHVSRVYVHERVCSEVDGLAFACSPLINRSIKLKRVSIKFKKHG